MGRQRNLAGRLKNLTELYTREKTVNDYGEDSYIYKLYCRVWAEIIPQRGSEEKVAIDVRQSVTHKFIIRNHIKITNDMYFMFKGQKYNVLYYMPHYADRDIIEVYCKLVTEDGESYGI